MRRNINKPNASSSQQRAIQMLRHAGRTHVMPVQMARHDKLSAEINIGDFPFFVLDPLPGTDRCRAE